MPTLSNKKKPKGVRCLDKHTGKIVYAYHIDESNIAFNKANTICIGCIGADLELAPKTPNHATIKQ